LNLNILILQFNILYSIKKLKNKRLLSVGGNKMMAIVDASTGKLLASPPIGGRVDGAGFDQKRQLAFSCLIY
jgi:hypothetical protein